MLVKFVQIRMDIIDYFVTHLVKYGLELAVIFAHVKGNLNSKQTIVGS